MGSKTNITVIILNYSIFFSFNPLKRNLLNSTKTTKLSKITINFHGKSDLHVFSMENLDLGVEMEM